MLGFYCTTGFLCIKLKCLESGEGRRSVYGECSEGPRLGKKKKSQKQGPEGVCFGGSSVRRGDPAS